MKKLLKLFALFLLVLISFVGTLACVMAATGNLSQERVMQLVKGPDAEDEDAEESVPADDVGPLARALQAREKKLDEHEEALKRREERVRTMLEELQELRKDVEDLQKEIQQALDDEAVDQKVRIEDVAKSISSMKPTNAAALLDDWPPEDAARVLRLVKERDRGKILDAMAPTKAASVLRSLQESPVLPDTTASSS